MHLRIVFPRLVYLETVSHTGYIIEQMYLNAEISHNSSGMERIIERLTATLALQQEDYLKVTSS